MSTIQLPVDGGNVLRSDQYGVIVGIGPGGVPIPLNTDALGNLIVSTGPLSTVAPDATSLVRSPLYMVNAGVDPNGNSVLFRCDQYGNLLVSGQAPGYPPASQLLTTASVGTSLGTVAAGNDPRFTATVTGADPTGATDSTAAFQAAHDALPATGGRINVPQGIFQVNGLNLTKQVILFGQGSRYGNGGGYLFTASPTGTIITVSTDGCGFQDLCLVNTAASPTAGVLLLLNKATQMHVTRCGFYGGWAQLQIVNGAAWNITDSTFSEARMYAIRIADVAAADSGDSSVVGNWIGTSSAVAGAVAIYQESGGGVKITNNKINGGGTAASQFTHGIYVNVPTTVGTTVLDVHGNSIENVSTTGVRVGMQGNGGLFGKVVITGTEFGYILGTAIYLGDSPLNAITDVLVSGNIVTNSGSGITIDRVTGGYVANNYFDAATVRGVVLTANASGVVVGKNARNGNGYLIQNASTGCAVDYTYCANIAVGSSAVIYRFEALPYSGAKLSIFLGGLAANVGEYVQTMDRLLTCGAAGSSIALYSVGTDTANGPGAAVPAITLNTAAVAGVTGVLQISAASTGAYAVYGQMRIQIEAQGGNLKIGA